MFVLSKQKCFYRSSTYLVNILIGCRHASKLSKRDRLFGIPSCHAAVMAGNRKIFKVCLNTKLEGEEPPGEHLREVIETAKMKDIPIVYRSSSTLNKLSINNNHQNIVVDASKLSYRTLSENIAPSEKEQFWVALDQIKDPMNFGAILRSCAYFGVNRVIVNNKNSCSLTAIVSNVSSGAVEWLPVYGVNSMKTFLSQSTESGWSVIGTMAINGDNVKSSLFSCENVDIDKPTILVIGNEGDGIDDDILECCSQLVTISSMNPSVPVGLDSLNVSVATGVMLHVLSKNQYSHKIQNMLRS